MNGQEWRTDPFPHVVIDGMWSDDLLREAAREFDNVQQWQHYTNSREEKLAAVFPLGGPAVQAVQSVLASDVFAAKLSEASGIPGLTFDGEGGGMHRIDTGGKLDLHVDFNVASASGRWRRVNVLIYLNEGWHGDCGGALQLWASDEDGVPTHCARTIEPVLNRTVIFVCSDTSWHGHPRPLLALTPRKSLAAYYFTQEPPCDPAPEPHSTIFWP